ncbi:SusC/RagA family TonB-linked outer membrane protein [Flavobacterium qiangtangense]|uniref:SusC/RagA family TonB-linked outer membrane protein n=1 Tax=Flavobacterium qiangtangense TaxID=1442595 RepID=A0ABW1PPD7_9FLAO
MKTIYKKLLLLLLLLPFSVLAQNTLSGNVKDQASGLGLPGVNVTIQGGSGGSTTDIDGNFLLSGVKSGDVISFNYLGYKMTTVTYAGQKNVSVTMEEDASQLEEVVVIGYGTTTKKDATGALTNITSEQFNKGPLVSADQLLQGRVAGLQITNGGGEPGGGSLIRIRSGSSLNANNDPLYVIDGVPVDAGGGGVEGGRNPLANINQNDIASMTILKDAAATAIYGSRASNGVVIITTKKGKSGEMQISYNGNFQVSEVVKTVDVLSADQYRAYINEFGNPETQVPLLGTANTDWQKEIYRTALSTDHNVAVSGGTDNIVYRASLGYSNLNGLLKHDNFERTTIGANVTGNFLDKHLKIEVNNKTSIIQNNFSEKSAIGAAVAFDPTQPVYQENAFGGFYQWANPTSGAYEVNASRNPVAFLEQKHNFGNTYRSIGNIQTEYKIHSFEDLKLVANFGYDYASGRSFGYTDDDYVVPAEAGSEYRRTQDNQNKVMDLYFNYNKTIDGLNTNVDVTGGYNYQDFRYSNQGFNYDAANDVLNPSNPTKERLNIQSFFGRATVTIADKYILNGSFRADGSSRFQKDNRWGYFPAAAVAWKIKEESFLKESTIVSDLKLRASWGITGQQDTGARYPSYPLYSNSTNTAAYQIGYNPDGSPIYVQTASPLGYNQDLKWEETTTINLGVDFGFFNNRVQGAVEVYKRETNDLIVFAPNPQGVNFSNGANYNIGSLENKGVEVSFDVYPIKNDNMTWRIGGNVTFQNSEITELTGSKAGFNVGGISGGTGTTVQNHQVGFAPSSFFVYEQAYDAAGAPLDGIYVDRNADGIVNADDKYRFRKPAADMFYGFNTDFSYKNWWFSMSWRGSVGNYNYNNVSSNNGSQQNSLPSNGNYLNNAHVSILDANFAAPRFESDYYIQDASFLRMDNVTVGYTFKNVFSEGSNMRLTGAVQNVFLITGYKGIDPENTSGIDNNLYPRPRTYTLGLNVNF